MQQRRIPPVFRKASIDFNEHFLHKFVLLVRIACEMPHLLKDIRLIAGNETLVGLLVSGQARSNLEPVTVARICFDGRRVQTDIPCQEDRIVNP